MDSSLPLHTFHVRKATLIVNRLYILLQTIALTLLFYYRTRSLITLVQKRSEPFIPHLLIFISELTLSFIWLLGQAFLWRPVTRNVFPERLPEDEKLPPIDVFICTADAEKEPPLGVMNTVISAMALDYPPGKLTVYLSDDGGCSATLKAMKEAWRFATVWVPFCRKYGVKTVCPEAYFKEEDVDNDGLVLSDEFMAEKQKMKEEYERFTQRVEMIIESESCKASRHHPCVVEVINDESFVATRDLRQLSRLVYVSREKRPSHPHHFKAGALNALLRVSSLLSNAPYILGLDCDMFCNDGYSARQAMCFHLDPKLSSSLAFVQYPQRFHNISENDIYESRLRNVFKTLWEGMDGLNGPCLSGTCYYLKKEALYGPPSVQEDIDVKKLKQSFGSSNEFIKSIHQKYNASMDYGKGFSSGLLEDTKLLASCTYENDTNWGKEVGFRYFSVVEDYFTSFNMQCNGWLSVNFYPPRPSFLGAGTTNLNDLLVQGTRWSAGLIEVGLSKFSPLIYGPLRMSTLHRMCYAWLALFPLGFLPLWILTTIPQLCLLNGTALYPEVKHPFVLVFIAVFLFSHLQNLREVFSTGDSVQTWVNEQRMWMLKGITSHLYGSVHAIMEKLGKKEASFLPTNKAISDEQEKLYRMGKYDFQTSTMLLVPLCSVVNLNLIALVGGMVKMFFRKDHDEMFIQSFLSLYITIMSYPVLEGMVLRKDKGRIPTSVTCYSLILSTVILIFGSTILMY